MVQGRGSPQLHVQGCVPPHAARPVPHPLTQHPPRDPLQGLLFAGESMLAVGFAAVAVEWAFSSGTVRAFGDASEPPAAAEEQQGS